MAPTHNIPAYLLASIRVRGNLAYVSAQGINEPRNLFEKHVYKDIFEDRVRAYLNAVSEGAKYEIARMKKGIA